MRVIKAIFKLVLLADRPQASYAREAQETQAFHNNTSATRDLKRSRIALTMREKSASDPGAFFHALACH
jgi:hypothetical protein